jgi:hypothetical protein
MTLLSLKSEIMAILFTLKWGHVANWLAVALSQSE